MTRKARTRAPKGNAAQKAAKPEPTTFREAFQRLNARQRKFVRAYLQRPNATWAAKQADYSEKTAYSIGHENLNKPDIRAALQLGWAEAGMSAEEVRARTEEVARASLADFLTFDEQIHRPYMHRPVRELHAELQAEIAFEDQYAARVKLDGKDLEAHQAAQAGRRRQLVRMEMELELDPAATHWVPGPPRVVRVERIDLAKAEERGVLHLLKKSKPTQWGPAIELEDRQHARDQIGKIHGLWSTDDDGGKGTSGLEELVKHMAERRRQRDEERGRT